MTTIINSEEAKITDKMKKNSDTKPSIGTLKTGKK